MTVIITREWAADSAEEIFNECNFDFERTGKGGILFKFKRRAEYFNAGMELSIKGKGNIEFTCSDGNLNEPMYCV